MEGILLCVGNILIINENYRSRLIENRVLDKIVIAKFSIFTSNSKICSHLLWMIANFLEKRFVVTDAIILTMLEKAFSALAKYPTKQNIEEVLFIMMFSLSRKGKTAEKIDYLIQLNGIQLCLHYFTKNVAVEITNHIGVCLCILKSIADAGHFDDFPANLPEVLSHVTAGHHRASALRSQESRPESYCLFSAHQSAQCRPQIRLH